MESVAITEHLIKLLPVAEPGLFDLVGYVISAVEGKPYQSLERHGRLDFQRLALVDHPAVGTTWKIQRHEQTGRLLQRDDQAR
ncbi:BnaCnng37530D [Brassica napus]|uniref:(rape) hypothetical protein n=1 Tax=Brassica napus TaxID=3708 RepID=A0A078J7V3_BRANA|nr:unnamed protein product [Brassica napus]CDY61252.1 BnaCnng37530D [Brassica napus]